MYLSVHDRYELSLSRIFGLFVPFCLGNKLFPASILYVKLIRESFANMSISPDKNLVVSVTWSLCLTASDLIEADSRLLNSKIIFVLF